MILEIAKTEVKSTQIHDISKLYEHFRYFFSQEGYAPTKDDDFPEIYYWEARTQRRGKEFFILWRGEKNASKTNFVVRYMELDFHGVGIKPVEIMHNGKKVKAMSGKMEVLLRAKLKIDPSGQWQKSKLWSSLFPLVYKKLNKKLIQVEKKGVTSDMYRMSDFAKNFFKLHTLSTKLDTFMPRKGFEYE